MARLAFGAATGASSTETVLDVVGLARSMGNARSPGQSLVQAKLNISLIGLVRSTEIAAKTAAGVVADLKRRSKLLPAQGWAHTKTAIQFFLNAIPTAPPQGGLSLTSLNSLSNPNFVAPGLSGARFVRGDLVPIQIKVRGQRLDGITPTFQAFKVGSTSDEPDIEKTGGAINQTETSTDTRSLVETFTADFSINPNDTSALPLGETVFIYTLTVSDGLGRVHTLESGKFTVFTVR
jgi:hypothetical protein